MLDTASDALKARWADPRQRDDLIAFIARELSKTGRLAAYASELRDLSTFLSAEDITTLYIAIRDESARLEFEWRSEFLSFFPRADSFLPDAEVSEEEFRHSLAAGQLRFVRPVLPSRKL